MTKVVGTSFEACCHLKSGLVRRLHLVLDTFITHSLFPLHTHPRFLSLMHSHTNVVSIIAGCCLFNDPIFPDRRVLSALSVTQREERQREYNRITPPTHTHTHTHSHTHTHTHAPQALLPRHPPLDFLCQQKL